MMTNFDELAKPWSIADCENRYVKGERIGLRALAKISGVSFDKLTYHSKHSDWVNKREEFQSALQAETDRKVIEQLSNAIAGSFSQVLIAHWQTSKKFRELIDLTISLHLAEVDDLKMMIEAGAADSTDLLNLLRKIKPLDLNFLSLTLDRAISSERAALALDYAQNENMAYNALKENFVIIPRQEFEAMTANHQPHL